MALIILLLFITVPIAEIALFIEIGGRIGLLATLGVVLLTAVAGTALLRQQGLATLFRVNQKLEEGRLPVEEIFDGVCLVLAGALLLTPGFLTDAVGFLLFLPPLRGRLARWIGRRLIAHGGVHVHTGPHPPRRPPPGAGPVIDGEFDEVRPRPENDDTPRRRIDRRDGS